MESEADKNESQVTDLYNSVINNNTNNFWNNTCMASALNGHLGYREYSDSGYSDSGYSDNGYSDTVSLSNENSNSVNLSYGSSNNANLSNNSLNDVNLSNSSLNNVNLNNYSLNNVNSSTANSSTEGSGGSKSSSSSSNTSGIEFYYKEPASNVIAKELTTRNIVNGNHVRYDFAENNTFITYIEFDAERTFLKTTTVEELKNKSIFVSKNPLGRLYKYVNVWIGDKGAGLPTSLKNGLVGFKVEKAWIKDNNVNESLKTLQWYNNDWEPLYTEKVGEDNNYAYFESKTPGFSSFAITEIPYRMETKTKFWVKIKYRQL